MAGRGAVSAFADHCEWTGDRADNREKWLISRRAGVGGSDVAAIMGVTEFNSALAVYVEKISKDPPDAEQSEIADWGRDFEPLILKRYAERSNRRVVRGGKLMRSKHAAHHLITLDGVQLTRPPSGAKGPGVAEVKTTGYGSRYHEDLPVEVQVQIQWELFVTGAQWATCIWLPFPERRMQWVDVMPHRAFQEVLQQRVDEFWGRVQRREPPDPDGSESSMLALRRLYPEERNETIRLRGDEAIALSSEYERNKAAIKLLELRQGLIKNTLAATMRESKYALLDDGRYWNTAFYPARENHCKLCSGVLSTQGAYKTYTLRDPRKKALPPVVAVRELENDSLTAQLEKSLEHLALAPGNDAPQQPEEKGAA